MQPNPLEPATVFFLLGVLRAWGRWNDPAGPHDFLFWRAVGLLILVVMVAAGAFTAASPRHLAMLVFVPLGAYKAGDLAGWAAMGAWRLHRARRAERRQAVAASTEAKP